MAAKTYTLSPMPRMDNGEFHSYISPSNTKCAKCPAAGYREFLVHRRNEFVIDYANHFIRDKAEVKIINEVFGDDTEQNNEGTLAHEWLEKKLRGDEEPGVPPAELQYPLERIAEGILDELSQASEVYLEERWINKGLDSGGSADVVYRIDDTIVVRDLKNGRVPVFAMMNWQLMRYAAGVLDRLGWPDDIKKVVMRIDATRFQGSEWVTTPSKLREFAKNILRKQLFDGNSLQPKPMPGTHCKNCDASPYCRDGWEWAERVLLEEQAIEGDFGDCSLEELEERAARIHAVISSSAMLDELKKEIKRRAKLNEQMMGSTGLKRCDLREGRIIKKWKPDVSEDAIRSAIEENITARKLVLTPGGKTRSMLQLQSAFPEYSTWIAENWDALKDDPDYTVEVFSHALREDEGLLFERKLKSPSQLTKIVEGDILQDMVVETQQSPALFIK